MRIMSFARRWGKLERRRFTTFRYPRKDKDWYVGEKLQVFIKNRSPHRIFLGIAEIVSKEQRVLAGAGGCFSGPGRYCFITDKEALADGFNGLAEMERFMIDYYGKDFLPAFNKLTLKWVS